MNPLDLWLRTTLFLTELDIVKNIYGESYNNLSNDIRDLLKLYLKDLFHSIDLLLCMYAYRDLQYGPTRKILRERHVKLPELRKRMKLGWIAYNINASQRLLDQWVQIEYKLWEWYRAEGYHYADEDSFKNFIAFLQRYIQTTIAELSVLYVYLYNNKIIMPLGFMQHAVTLGPSGPALGDFIDIETLTFIEVKSRRRKLSEFKQDLLSLAINTRLPSAIAVPRYGVAKDKDLIDKNIIVIDLYILAAAGSRQWIDRKDEYMKALIEDELKSLMQNISLLEENAREYLQELREKNLRSKTRKS